MRQLEIEHVALTQETDAGSRERLAAIDAELANLRERSDGMKAHAGPASATPSAGSGRSSGSPSGASPSPLALAILLEGRYAEGDTVRVDVAGEDLVLK